MLSRSRNNFFHQIKKTGIFNFKVRGSVINSSKVNILKAETRLLVLKFLKDKEI